MDVQTRKSTIRQGFTLIELLVVIAITAVLFFLMLRPLIESLRLTQRAQLQAAAQDSARKTLEIVTRELSSAVYVFDNASHPFPASANAPVLGDDRFTNFLDLDIPKDPNNGGGSAVAHAYNAKLDFVPARHSGTAAKTAVDPTTGEPISLDTGTNGGSAAIKGTGLQFPLAPGSSIIRYYVGLKDPTKSYTNSTERLGSGSVDNTYVLYRAQANTSTINAATGKSEANTELFPLTADGKPEFDDPDFFRYVTNSDINWLSPTHAPYTTAEVADHDKRVDNWMKIAKPIITAPNIDLLLLPREADGTVHFDSSGTFAKIPHSGVSYDPVQTSHPGYPTVNTSVTFKPATLTADAAPGTTSDYGNQGVPTNALDNGGLPYVPTIYATTTPSWSYPPNITVYQYDNQTSADYFTTDMIRTDTDVVAVSTLTPKVGDLLEYYHPAAGGGPFPVYDITQGIVIKGANLHHYIPMSVNTDTGTINFAAPAMPSPPNQNSTLTGASDSYQRYWSLPDNTSLNSNTLACTPKPGVIDLTLLYSDGSGKLTDTSGTNTSPLSKLGLTTSGLATTNAFVVPGSVRVYGPDQAAGPNLGNRVLYTAVPPSAPLSYNQYRVDYVNSMLTFYVDASNLLPVYKADGATVAAPVQFTFDYQANLAPGDPGQPISRDNPASPLQVKVDYRTKDLLDVNIGVRVYDPTDGQAFTVPVSNRIKVNNSNR